MCVGMWILVVSGRWLENVCGSVYILFSWILVEVRMWFSVCCGF